LYIHGNSLKNTINKITSEFNNLYNNAIENIDDFESLISDLKVDDIYIKTIEEDVEEIIKENRDKISNKKKIFNLDKNIKSDHFEEKVHFFNFRNQIT
jgi:hypothetical protein